MATAAFTGADEKKFEYVGSAKCKKCHLPEHKSWEKTKKGHALDTLMPDEAVEAKTKFKLDPKKDYSRDASCVSCHVTGFGKPGGYEIPAEGDAAAAKAMAHLAHVGCESCHGPGSEYIKVHEDVFKTKRKYKVEEFYAAGMTKIEASTCTSCHNDKSPTFDAAAGFKFEEMKEKRDLIHEKVPLKYRE
jgi:formate-dependent nitrite reductase cytochrome c552 subunit